MNDVDKFVEEIDEGEEIEEAGAGEPVEDPVDEMERVAAPVLAMIQERPMSGQSLKVRLSKELGNSKLVEEAVDWLEEHKRIERFKNFAGAVAYRIPGQGVTPTAKKPLAPASSPAAAAAPPAPPRAPTPPPQPKKEARVTAKTTVEWIDADAVAKMLDIVPSYANVLARNGKIKGRKVENSGKKGRAPWEFLRSSVLAHQLNFLEPGETPPRTPRKVALVHKPKIEVTVAPVRSRKVAAPASDLEAQLRWVVDGHRLGRFSADQVVEQLVELLG